MRSARRARREAPPRASDPAAVHKLAARICLTGIGVPFGLAALIIGLGWLHHG